MRQHIVMPTRTGLPRPNQDFMVEVWDVEETKL